MNKRLQGFIAGIIIASIFTTIPVFADSIDVLFNQINIKLNGNQIARAGDNYTLQNGEKVPYSISYKNTTYLPMRKVAELLGKDVQWDGNTNTANIAEKNAITSNGFTSYFNSYKGVYLKINNDGLYSSSNFEIYSICSKDDKYYLALGSILPILNILGSNYSFEKSSNPFLKGDIRIISPKYTENIMSVFLDVNTSYLAGSIYDTTDKTKAFTISLKPNAEEGGVVISDRFYVNLEDILNYFGYKDKVKVEFDDTNKNIIIVINK